MKLADKMDKTTKKMIKNYLSFVYLESILLIKRRCFKGEKRSSRHSCNKKVSAKKISNQGASALTA